MHGGAAVDPMESSMTIFCQSGMGHGFLRPFDAGGIGQGHLLVVYWSESGAEIPPLTSFEFFSVGASPSLPFPHF